MPSGQKEKSRRAFRAHRAEKPRQRERRVIGRPCICPQDRHIGASAASSRICSDDRRGDKGDPSAAAALVVFVGSAATILGAWYFQYVLKLPPCPLCLEERLPYHIVIPLSLLLAIAAIVRAPRALIVVGFLAIIAAMLISAALGAYHAGVEWRWWPGPTDCSGPMTDFTTNGPLLKQLQSIHVVRCDEAAWRFLGLSLAGYNVLISLALAAIAALGLMRREPA
jgi:disulfide bond formation protein DsbB